MKEDVKPESFVESVKDDSKVSLSFKKKPTKDKKQTVTIIAKDEHGNKAMKETTLTLVKDIEKANYSYRYYFCLCRFKAKLQILY